MFPIGVQGPAHPRREHLRLLHEKSEMGYTDRLDKAMRDEPEAVSREVQQGLSEDARLRARNELVVVVTRMTSDLAFLRARSDRRIRSELRVMHQALETIRRRL